MTLTPIELQVLYSQSTEISRVASYQQMHPYLHMQMHQEFFRKLTEDKQKMVNSNPTSSEDSVKTDEKEEEIAQKKNEARSDLARSQGKGRNLDIQM